MLFFSLEVGRDEWVKRYGTSEGLQIQQPAGGLTETVMCRKLLGPLRYMAQVTFLRGKKNSINPRAVPRGTNAVIRIAAGMLSSLTFPHIQNSMNLHSWGCLTAR